MKKIMFNDRYGLTEAVLSGRKTMTRRIIKRNQLFKRDPDGMWTDDEKKAWEKSGISECDFANEEDMHNAFEWLKAHAPFKVGEIVAIAQSYKDAGVIHIPCEDDEFGCYDFPAEQTHGWNNKMFVRADLMSHNIQIKGHKVERLQDISDEDCIKEGVVKVIHTIHTKKPQYLTKYYPCQYLKECADKVGWGRTYSTPRKAFATLIDKVSGKGTWDSNPYVFAYEFELVK